MTNSYPRCRAATPAAYVMLVLFGVNVVGYLDRQVLSLLVQPIKAAFGLSDGAIGLIQGTAFVVTFALASLFVGRIVDRGSRRNLLISCIAVWTIGAVAGGLAQSGVQLFIARMAVGAGEAALLPCAISLIADYYPADRRGNALGIFSMGIYAGAGLSLVLVGMAMPLVTDLSRLLAAHGLDVAPWRLVLVSLAIPGMAAVGALATIDEPRRETSPLAGGIDWSGFRDWAADFRVFLPHHLGWALANVCQYAIAGWLPTVLIREHGFDTRGAGLAYGIVIAAFGVAGAYSGGKLADWRLRAGGPVARMNVAVALTALAAAGFILIGTATGAAGVLAGAACVAAGMGVTNVVGLAVLSDLAPARSRGQITSIYLTAITVVAAAGGPAIVGYGNDLFGGPGVRLSTVLGGVGSAFCVGAILVIMLAIGQIRKRSTGLRVVV